MNNVIYDQQPNEMFLPELYCFYYDAYISDCPVCGRSYIKKLADTKNINQWRKSHKAPIATAAKAYQHMYSCRTPPVCCQLNYPTLRWQTNDNRRQRLGSLLALIPTNHTVVLLASMALDRRFNLRRAWRDTVS